MIKAHRAVITLLLLTTALSGSAQAQERLVPNTGVPPNANTTDPGAPFYIDLSMLDLTTRPGTRNPLNPVFPKATALPDGALPPPGAMGNFILGPTHAAAPETVVDPRVPKGRLVVFTMTSDDSVIYKPGRARQESYGNEKISAAQHEPGDPSSMIITDSHPATWTRTVTVYIPAGYKAGSKAPVLVTGDGNPASPSAGQQLFTVLDNLIAARRVPAMVAITIQAGGQDAQGSERGREYDTVSGAYAQFVESEVLPLVERKAGVTLSHDPDARAALGVSSSGSAAFAMAWFRPDLYHRVLAYSPTFVNQQWPHDPSLPGGAWEFHSPWPGPRPMTLAANGSTIPTLTTSASGSPLVPNSPHKPIRFWFEVGDRDLFYPALAMTDGMHDWVIASENMARVLAAKNYEYQFLFSRNAGHVDRPTVNQTLAEALEWVWAGYPRPIQ